MSLWIVMLVSAAVFAAGYLLYGKLLARLFRLDPSARTPAEELKDDVDYIPTDPKYLLGQHFSAISAAGPIVGPILAGKLFGWVPALLWILVGSIFIGGVHDLGALVASVRHKARSIAEVVKEHTSRLSYVLFLSFVWITIVYIIVAFTDIVASSFVGVQTLEDGTTVKGGGIATSSMLYLALPVVMALLMRYAKLGLAAATAVFLPLVGVAIWAGPHVPFDLQAVLGLSSPQAGAKVWDVLLCSYCFVAALIPMWVLLQPRGHLGGFFLYVAMAGGILGILFGGKTARYPAFTAGLPAAGEALFPILFITVACGACSGFHALVASGTTSKQLRRETDAKPIAYGGMLLEGLVAVIALSCLMMFDRGEVLKGAGLSPNLIFGIGISEFLGAVGVPAAFGLSFGLLAFTTFVYDTLDVCTRLGRFILQELTGWKGAAGKVIATAATAGAPLLMVLQTMRNPQGKVVSAWSVFWSLFGASNQLLAALTLMGVTVWLVKTRKAWWAWLVTGLPMTWMYAMSLWALLRMIVLAYRAPDGTWKRCLVPDAPTGVAIVLVALALLLLGEMVRVLLVRKGGTGPAERAGTGS